MIHEILGEKIIIFEEEEPLCYRDSLHYDNLYEPYHPHEAGILIPEKPMPPELEPHITQEFYKYLRKGRYPDLIPQGFDLYKLPRTYDGPEDTRLLGDIEDWLVNEGKIKEEDRKYVEISEEELIEKILRLYKGR